MESKIYHSLYTDSKLFLRNLFCSPPEFYSDPNFTVIRYWQKMDFEMCQGIQKLVFPEGVKWDKESRSFRIINYNSFFEILHCVSDSYKNRQEKEEDKSCDLSSLVAGGGLEPPASGL